MIRKIIKIDQIGRFANYSLTGWNGELQKINVIYAPNGSGKTTLATILKSLDSGDSRFIEIKKTFDATQDQTIELILGNSVGKITYQNGKWDSHNLKIEVLDILFIEDYLYTGSVLQTANKRNLFKLLTGDYGQELSNRYRQCKGVLNTSHSRLNSYLVLNNPEKEKAVLDNIEKQKDELKKIETEIKELSDNIFSKYVEIANRYLLKFAPYIQFEKFEFESLYDNSKKLRLKLVVSVHGKRILFSSPDFNKKTPTVKYSLSEGDKSAIALCFFLARLEVLGYADKIVVFDDPLSSFDSGRKLTTINSLAKIAENCEQFFLLTHDIHFAKDFTEKLSHVGVLNLKIENDGKTSLIVPHDIFLDTLSNLQKDYHIVKGYLKNEVATDIERREIIRCIRPVLEGVIKAKYFDLIPSKDWLGDIISSIRNCDSSSRLFKLKSILDDIIDLNDYSKSFHHSDETGLSKNINPFELKKYVELLMVTVDKI